MVCEVSAGLLSTPRPRLSRQTLPVPLSFLYGQRIEQLREVSAMGFFGVSRQVPRQELPGGLLHAASRQPADRPSSATCASRSQPLRSPVHPATRSRSRDQPASDTPQEHNIPPIHDSFGHSVHMAHPCRQPSRSIHTQSDSQTPYLTTNVPPGLSSYPMSLKRLMARQCKTARLQKRPALSAAPPSCLYRKPTRRYPRPGSGLPTEEPTERIRRLT